MEIKLHVAFLFKIYVMINIEKLEELPFRESFYKNRNPFDKYSHRYRVPVSKLRNGLFLYRYIDIVLSKSIGKKFDTIFTKICKHIPKYAQHLVLKEFEYSSYSSYYYIDSNRNIQIVLGNYDRHKKETKKKYEFKSYDTKYHYADPINGNIITPEKYDILKYLKPYKNLYFKNIPVTGIQKTFTQKTAEYRRLTQNDNKLRRKIERVISKNKRVDYEFMLRMGKLRNRYPDMVETPKTPNDRNFYYNHRTGKSAFTIANEKMDKLMERDKEDNLVKILKHGFDPDTSFKKDKE